MNKTENETENKHPIKTPLSSLRGAVEAAREAIDERVADYVVNNRIEKIAADAAEFLLVPLVVGMSDAQRAVLADALAVGVANFLIDGANEAATEFLAAFPLFAKEAVGASAAEVAALRDARAALKAAKKKGAADERI